jgi:hypothetical protein
LREARHFRRMWHEAEPSVRAVYYVIAVEIAFGFLLLAGYWPGL